MANLKHYLIICRNERFWFVGPFDCHERSVEWGEIWQTRGNDDPRWQTIELPDTAFAAPPQLFAPGDTEAVENGEPDVALARA